MNIASNLVRLTAVLFLFGLQLVAQKLTITPGDVIPAGTAANVEYADSARAGQTITVVVTGGSPPESQNIVIVLDASGKGSAQWTPPAGWTSATFTAPSVDPQTVLVR